MISFESDYNNGTLPEILEALGKTNDEKTSGYGFDPYTEAAKEKIRKTISMEDADVTFLVGGTQTNTTVIDSVLWDARELFVWRQDISRYMSLEPWKPLATRSLPCPPQIAS